MALLLVEAERNDAADDGLCTLVQSLETLSMPGTGYKNCQIAPARAPIADNGLGREYGGMTLWTVVVVRRGSCVSGRTEVSLMAFDTRHTNTLAAAIVMINVK